MGEKKEEEQERTQIFRRLYSWCISDLTSRLNALIVILLGKDERVDEYGCDLRHLSPISTQYPSLKLLIVAFLVSVVLKKEWLFDISEEAIEGRYSLDSISNDAIYT